MSDTCPNCDKPVLPTDTSCWHCGYKLARKPVKAAAPAKAARSGRPARKAATEAAPIGYDFRAIAVYGGLTLLVVVALWLVMSALGRRPLLVRSALELGSDWVAVTDSQLRYTLNLPPDWQWLDVAYRGQEGTLDELLGVQGYIGRALRPVGDAAADLEIAGVALGTRTPEDGQPTTFVVVGRSEALRGAAPEVVLASLGERRPDATETAVDTHLPGQPQARFTILDGASAYQCRHLVVADAAAAGYLVAACAPQGEFGNRDRDLKAILDSFQLLQP